jgi:hypothetical protein
MLHTAAGVCYTLLLVYVIHGCWYMLYTAAGVCYTLQLVYVTHCSWYMSHTAAGTCHTLQLVYVIHYHSTTATLLSLQVRHKIRLNKRIPCPWPWPVRRLYEMKWRCVFDVPAPQQSHTSVLTALIHNKKVRGKVTPKRGLEGSGRLRLPDF